MLSHSFFNKTGSGQLGQEIEEKDFDAKEFLKEKQEGQTIHGKIFMTTEDLDA